MLPTVNAVQFLGDRKQLGTKFWIHAVVNKGAKVIRDFTATVRRATHIG